MLRRTTNKRGKWQWRNNYKSQEQPAKETVRARRAPRALGFSLSDNGEKKVNVTFYGGADFPCLQFPSKTRRHIGLMRAAMSKTSKNSVVHGGNKLYSKRSKAVVFNISQSIGYLHSTVSNGRLRMCDGVSSPRVIRETTDNRTNFIGDGHNHGRNSRTPTWHVKIFFDGISFLNPDWTWRIKMM